MAGSSGDFPNELARLANYLARRFATGESYAQATRAHPAWFEHLSDADVAEVRRLGRLGAEAYTELYAFGPDEPLGDVRGGPELLSNPGAAQVVVGFGPERPQGGYSEYRTYIVAIRPESTRAELEDAARAAAVGNESPGIDGAFSSAELTAILPFDPDTL